MTTQNSGADPGDPIRIDFRHGGGDVLPHRAVMRAVHEDAEIPPQRRLGAIIGRQFWLVLIVIWLAICMALAVTALQTPKYKATMSLVVGQAGGNLAPDIGNQALTQTMTTLLQSDAVASETIDRLKLNMSTADFLQHLGVTVIPSSSVLDVSYTGTDPKQIERVLGEVSRSFTRLAQEKLAVASNTTNLSDAKHPIVFATVYDPPRADPKPISPKRGVALITAGALGLVIGLILAFVRERLDDRVRSREEAEEAFGLPVIGVVPRTGRRDGPRRRRALSEALALLSLNLEVTGRPGPRGGTEGTILVTSTEQEEGKSLLVANLALALARDGDDVLCVEADPRGPTLGNYLDVTPASMNGMLPAAGDPTSLEPLLQPVALGAPEDGGVFEPAGRLRLLSSERWKGTLRALAREDRGAQAVGLLGGNATHVIIDGSPLTVGETSRLAMLAGRVVVVARIGKTRRSQARTASERLERLGVRPVGVVLTDVKGEGA